MMVVPPLAAGPPVQPARRSAAVAEAARGGAGRLSFDFIVDAHWVSEFSG